MYRSNPSCFRAARQFTFLGLCCLAPSYATAQATLYNLQGDEQFSNYGNAIAGLGDIDGDGINDLVVGEPDYGQGAGADPLPQGRAHVYSGATGATLFTFTGGDGYRLGQSVANAGDIDGDGVSDILVGGPGWSGLFFDVTGRATVYSGATGAILRTHLGDPSLDGFGASVAGAGDINGDGWDDYMVGIPEDSNFGFKTGLVRVFSGLDGSVLFDRHGTFVLELFGSSLAGLGDLNGDGFTEILVGTAGWTSTASATVIAGPAGATLFTKVGIPSDRFGSALSGIGDVNGDGVNDWAVGASLENSGRGSVQVFSGQTGFPLFRIDGTELNGQLGTSVAGAGDFDGDGTPDIIVGVTNSALHGAKRGSAEIRSGVDGALLHVRHGSVDFGRYGVGVAGLGDVNGDGLDDVAAGGRDENAGHGGVDVIAGGPGCFSFTNYCSTSPNSFGAGAQISGTGSSSVVVNDLGLLATGAVPGQSALFFMGPNQIATPFGNGVRCVGGSVKRLGVVSPDAAGVASLALDNGSAALSGLLIPGSVWNFQLWYRDTGVGSGFNLSDGMNTTICP